LYTSSLIFNHGLGIILFIDSFHIFPFSLVHIVLSSKQIFIELFVAYLPVADFVSEGEWLGRFNVPFIGFGIVFLAFTGSYNFGVRSGGFGSQAYRRILTSGSAPLTKGMHAV
jgi:hypothetical protein